MSHYRAHRLSENGQHSSRVDFHSANDQEAVKVVKQFPAGFDIEVWQDQRKVILLKAQERD